MKVTYQLDEMAVAVKALAPWTKAGQIITLEGGLGAGKTTLVKALLAAQGVREPVTSPTYGYVKQYTTAQGGIVYHFDLYRLEHGEEFLAAGFDEYLRDTTALVLIEWPAVIAAELGVFKGRLVRCVLSYAADESQRCIDIFV